SPRTRTRRPPADRRRARWDAAGRRWSGGGGGSRKLVRGYFTPQMPAPRSSEPPSRIRIALPQPAIDGGTRYAPKRCVGDTVTVSADIFRDGHEILRAVVRYRA